MFSSLLNSDGATPTSPTSPISIASSLTSDVSLASRAVFLYPTPAVDPLPAYVAFAAASQLATDNHQQDGGALDRESALFTEHALGLINAFLDELLYSFISNARSMSLLHLENAVENVLKGRLAQMAIEAAHAELQELLEEEDDVQPPGTPQGDDSLTQEDIDLVFKRTRLRIMVYMRLGEMEDEDEERYVQQESSTRSNGTNKRFSQSSRMMPWSAAIFLTSVLEFVAEQCITASGKNAYNRVKQKRAKQQAHTTNSTFDYEERVYVDEHDVEKLALSSILSRLWRIWRKNLRNRPRSRGPPAPQTPQTRHLGERDSSASFRPQSPADRRRDEYTLGSIGSDESDTLPKQVTIIPSQHSVYRQDVQSDAKDTDVEDGEGMARAPPTLTKIPEDEDMQGMQSSDDMAGPALHPINNRSSLQSHPIFDAANYPPEIAAAAGLSSNSRPAVVALHTDMTSDDDPFDLSPPKPVTKLPVSALGANGVWSKGVAERVFASPTITPSQNAFAAQARATGQATRSRSGTANSLDGQATALPPLKSILKSPSRRGSSDIRTQPPLSSVTVVSSTVMPPQGRKGSVVTMTSPADSEYSIAPTLGMANVAHSVKAHAITPPRSEDDQQDDALPPRPVAAQPGKARTPLKIPRHVIPSSPGTRSASGSKAKLVARDPKIEGESIRDFADFIRSTAPAEDQKIVPLVDPASVRTNGARKHSASTGPGAARHTTKPLPSLPPNAPGNPISATGKRRSSKPSLQPRDAVVRTRDTSDLVDFFRAGPPGASIAQATSNDNLGSSTSTADRSGSVVSQSAQGSVTSNSGLIGQRALAPRLENRMPHVATNHGLQAEPQHTKTRRRIRDPYALPSSDDEDDDLTALPNNPRRQNNNESLLDFLQNTSPPSYTGSKSASATAPMKAGAKSASSSTHPNFPQSSRHSPTPSKVLSTSAFYGDSPGDAPRLPDFASNPPMTIDLNHLQARDPMLSKYNDFDSAAPAPNVNRDRTSKQSMRDAKKSSGFWNRL